MPKFERLRKLMGSRPEVDPEYSSDHNFISGDYSKAYPRFEDMLRNARDKAIDFQQKQYMNRDFTRRPVPKGARSEPGILDTLVQDKSPETQSYLKELHEKNIWLNDPDTEIDRHDVLEMLAREYVRDTHPEMLQNMKQTIKDSRGSTWFAPKPELDELLEYQKKIARDVSGLDKNTEPKNYELNPMGEAFNRHGSYNYDEDKVEVSSPYGFSTPVHEYLHKKDGVHSGGNEILKDANLKSSDQMAKDIIRNNNYHIREKLDVQKDQRLNRPPGVSAAFYNRISKLLEEK